MKFKSTPEKRVMHNGNVITFNSSGELSTNDKELIEALKSMSDVKVVKRAAEK